MKQPAPKIKTYRKGYATMERLSPSGYYELKLRTGALDELRVKEIYDDKDEARERFKELCAMARAA